MVYDREIGMETWLAHNPPQMIEGGESLVCEDTTP